MSFSKKCGCLKHSEWTAGEPSSLKTLSQRPYPTVVIDGLIKDSILPPRVKYICEQCGNKALSIYGESEDSPSKRIKIRNTHIESAINEINSGVVCEEDLVEITEAIAKSQYESFKLYTEEKCATYRQTLNSIDISKYTLGINIVLFTFLINITGYKQTNTPGKKHVALCAAIDCLMAVVNSHAVTPLFFIISITCYFITGSKAVCNLLSNCTPSGTYTLLKSWFSSISERPLVKKIVACRDFISYFDNSQILSRNWRVRYQAKALINVITSVIHIVPSKESNIQMDDELSPRHWLHNKGKVNIDKCLNSHCDLFTIYRNNFIQDIINCVSTERYDTPDIVDNINYICPKGDTTHNPYQFVPNLHNNTPEVHVGEPCLVNPCSYIAITKVLEHLSNEQCIDQRKWTMIGCDGLPYVLASRLIEKNDHLKHILLQPGLGHIEINMTKGLFKLLWDVCISDIANMLGYHSLKAQTACKNAGDHHKSWQILNTLLFGTAKELIVPFIDVCKNEGTAPTLNNYYKWLNTVEDPCYSFMQEAIFTYVFSAFLFRAATRRNNSKVLTSARQKFSPLFYGLNQTGYQELEYRDFVTRQSAPEPVLKLLEDNESYTVSGHDSKGEGGDFLLEAINRRIKMMMPPGLATEERWLRVCRSYDEVNQIRHNIYSNLGEEETDSSYVYHASLEMETLQWRRRLRACHYFQTPNEKRDHVSTTGTKLDSDLLHFSQHCKGNKVLYLEEINKGKEPGKGEKLTPVFITPEDRTKFRSIENKTIKDIDNLIATDINDLRQMNFIDEANNLQQTFSKKVKGATKAVYIEFYRTDLTVTMDNCLERRCREGNYVCDMEHRMAYTNNILAGPVNTDDTIIDTLNYIYLLY